MEKRLFLAIALSLLILLTWSALVPKPQLVGSKSVTAKNLTNNSINQVDLKQSSPLVLVKEASPESLIRFSQKGLDIVFDEKRAAIKEVLFKGNREHKFPLKAGFLTDDGSLDFRKESEGADYITFVHYDKIKKITKKFTFKPNYTLELDVSLQNLSNLPLNTISSILVGQIDLSNLNTQLRYQDVFVVNSEKSLHLPVSKDYKNDTVKILGFRDQYFCVIVEPAISGLIGYIKKGNQESEIGFKGDNIILNPAVQIGHLYRIYLGPQDLPIINKVNPNWSGIIYFGMFDFIAQLILQLLNFFYGIVHNWGWAIVILSLAVYAALFPLSLKQMRSMKEMQILQPKIEELRKAYKDNPQKLNKEIMDLYKEHKVNPLGGCLPLLLQMPIFFALYQALIRSVALRGAKFLWIKDLSEPDKLFSFSKGIPILGSDVNILPILMAIGMFVQQKISMSKAGDAAAEQQKIMLIIMPVMFGVIFYNMPSGLVLYWFINSALMLFYQFKIYKQV